MSLLNRATVFFPSGPPKTTSGKSALFGHIFYLCGEDAAFIYDRPMPLGEGRDMMVVLTDVGRLELDVIRFRDRACQAYPLLSKALWIIFLEDDPRLRKSFLDASAQLGEMQGTLNDAPLWVTNSGRIFLVLVANLLCDIRHLQFQAGRAMKTSPQRGSGSISAMRVVTPPPPPLSSTGIKKP
jgi:hypothetical protein